RRSRRETSRRGSRPRCYSALLGVVQRQVPSALGGRVARREAGNRGAGNGPRARRVDPLQRAALEVGRATARWCATADAVLNGGRLRARTLAPVVGNAGSSPARRTNQIGCGETAVEVMLN